MEANFETKEGSATNWQQMYMVAERWESDLKFFRDEIIFFRQLMNRYFYLLLEDMEKTRLLADGLKELEKERMYLMKVLKLHMRHVREHFDSPFVLADPAYLDEHAKLETEFSGFVKRFRTTKKGLFRKIDRLLKSERHQHMISNL